MLLRHRGLSEIEKGADIGRKLDGLVYRIQADGVVQEGEVRLLVGMPFNLVDYPLLLFVHGANGWHGERW